MDIKTLLNENNLLKKKLTIAQRWMEREVKSQIRLISKNKISNLTLDNKDDFFSENIEEMVNNQVVSFFWELILLNTPDFVIDNIISAEILFYNFRKNKKSDWLGVLTSYQKSIDYIIEQNITKPFRKFAIKKWQTSLRKNDPLEKTLNMVVNKWYIIWVWKLYHIMDIIKNNKESFDYVDCFKDFLERNIDIKNLLEKKEFHSIFKKLIETDVFWKKRHLWKVTFEDAQKARELIVWNLNNKKSIIFMLIEMSQVDI